MNYTKKIFLPIHLLFFAVSAGYAASYSDNEIAPSMFLADTHKEAFSEEFTDAGNVKGILYSYLESEHNKRLEQILLSAEQSLHAKTEEAATDIQISSSSSSSTDMRSSQKRSTRTCDTCSKSFRNFKNFQNHKCIYRCNFDGCKFSSEDIEIVTNHERLHAESSEHKYTCDTCSKSFQNLKRFKKHKCILRCNFDGCTFTSKHPSSLTRHKYTHDKTKLIKCTYEGCAYDTTDPSNFKKHLQTHYKTKFRRNE
jgi:stress-induced morphogen